MLYKNVMVMLEIRAILTIIDKLCVISTKSCLNLRFWVPGFQLPIPGFNTEEKIGIPGLTLTIDTTNPDRVILNYCIHICAYHVLGIHFLSQIVLDADDPGIRMDFKVSRGFPTSKDLVFDLEGDRVEIGPGKVMDLPMYDSNIKIKSPCFQVKFRRNLEPEAA